MDFLNVNSRFAVQNGGTYRGKPVLNKKPKRTDEQVDEKEIKFFKSYLL